MKNKCIALLLIALLCLSACGRAVPPEETDSSAAQTTEEITTAKQYPAPKPPEAVNTDYVFTSTWAKTPAHFYAVLHTPADDSQGRFALSRVPLRDISKPEVLSLPEEYKGYTLKSMNICGVTAQWLFIDCGYEKYESGIYESTTHVLFRMSLESLEAEAVEDGEGYQGNTWYNAGSNSLIFYNYDGVFEALRLDTGERSEIEKPDLPGWLWHNTTDGLIVCGLEGGDGDRRDTEVIVIDSENKATVVPFKSLKLIPRPWERETEIDVPPNGEIKKMLDWEDDQGNSISGLQPMDDMLLVIVWSIYGTYDGYFHALYDPAADAVFSAE